MHLRMAGWRQRLEQHTYCVAEELDEEDGIHTIERKACSSESHATVRMRTTLGSELHAFKSLRATRISRARFSTGKAKTPGN